MPTGHLVYGAAGTLDVALDLGRLAVAGTPALVLEGVATTATGASEVAVAANGSLVYIPGGAGLSDERTVRACGWIARDVRHRCLACRWTRTATFEYRPTAGGLLFVHAGGSVDLTISHARR